MASDATAIPAVEATPDRLPLVLREIARGGLAGLATGLLVCGIGGRLVMRLATLLVPEAIGARTENGFRIGDITPGGTISLVATGFLVFGPFLGVLWVIIRPWLPSGLLARILATTPFVVAIGTPALVNARNEDFEILGHDPAVVASLILVVALVAPVIVLVDAWLERRLPPGDTGSTSIKVYTAMTVIGLILTMALVVPTTLGSQAPLGAVALLVLGFSTLGRWWLIVEDRPMPAWLPMVGRAAFVVATVLALVEIVPEVRGALGLVG